MENDKKWEIPEKYRIGQKNRTQYEQELLIQADAKQADWAKITNNPFTQNSPKERERMNAVIMLAALKVIAKPSSGQCEIIAENYAILGFYAHAGEYSRDEQKRAEYYKYEQAVWCDDDDWCEHAAHHKFIKDNIFSIKHLKDVPLIACNVCGMWNAANAPEELAEARKVRERVRNAIAPSNSIKNLLEQHKRLG